MGKLVWGGIIVGLAFAGYELLKPRPGYCIETTSKTNSRDKCVVSCYGNRLKAQREYTEIWKKMPNLHSRVFKSENTLRERSCG